MFKIEEVNCSQNDIYREKLWNLLKEKLTGFKNQIYYVVKNNKWEEIWYLRIVYDFEEKYFEEYSLKNYHWKIMWFFTWIFVNDDYRKQWIGTKLFLLWLEKFKTLWQEYVFSDARDSSLGIFLKNWFEIIWQRIAPEWYKQTVVIKKMVK